ncbi:sugar transferase [Qipengyuania nanhaisediminis]|uniref:sugar transferase n=1 Tax=Qipengyuania nanhaisediminis TaxID=604088 RepID=UPI0015A68EBD|nr:sugar transferase [Qipengyuania nanhaisediminis]
MLAIVDGVRPLGLEETWTWLTQPGVANSFVGSCVCALFSIGILRRLRYLPGVAVARSILPIVALMFGLMIGAIAGLRLEYYNKLIVSCFFGVLLARFAITAMRSRAKGLLYYVVPGGRSDLILQLKSAPAFTLNSPSLVSLPDCAIVADLHADLGEEWERFLADAAISGRPIYHYKHVWEAETGKVQIDHLSENNFGALLPSSSYQRLKRAIDLLSAITVLPIAIVIIGICVILIKRDSQGSVIFRQRRVGFRGVEFEVLKLRTMINGHNGEDSHLSITQSADGRVTKVGRFLRRTRLDELPQIYNVIRGEMSWVGPRPEAVSLSKWYENEIPFYRYRHMVRPGITGWAQVNQGHVVEIGEADEKLQYDFYYVKNLSYWLDTVIALRTVKVIFSGFGAK